MSQVSVNNPSPAEVIAAMPKDQLRSLFYLFAAKPDSRIKVFEEPIHLMLSDIVELNDCVSRKLKIHNIEANITSVTVAYRDADVNEFGTWAEFSQHHWQDFETVEEVVVKWDFLAKIESYAMPQRHTLLFRVSDGAKPGKVMQMLFSGNADDFENFDVIGAPSFCRVDFINAQLSKELINVVTDWHKGRRSPKLISDFLYKLKKNRQFIAEATDYVTTFSLTILLVSYYYWVSIKYFDSQLPVHIALCFIFMGMFVLRLIAKIANLFAKLLYKSLGELEGSRVVFEFTSGDKKQIAEQMQKNKKQGIKFAWNAFWNIALNLVASGI